MVDNDSVIHAFLRRQALGGAVLATTLALSGCSGISEFLSDDEDEPQPAELVELEAALGIDTLWHTRATSGEGDQRLELRPAVTGGRVFVAGHDGDVAAYDSSDGTRLWQVDTGISISGGPGAGYDVVVVGGDGGEVVALAGANGEVAWRAPVSSEVLSAPAVGDGVVVVRDGKLFGIDANNGDRLWVHDRTVPVLTLRGTGAPVIAGETVIAGFDSGHLVAVSLANGELLWEAQAATPTGRTELERLVDIDADPAVSDGIVYVASYQGNVAAYELTTGRRGWQREMSSSAGIGVGPSLLFVTDAEGHVWALDRSSGSSPWRQDGLALRDTTGPVGIGNHVVVGDFEGYVHWLSVDDGRFAARARVDGAVHAPPVVTDDAVFILSARGELTAFAVP